MGYGIITQRDFAYAPEQALYLRGSEFLRVLNYPNWARIRMGFLADFERNDYSVVTTRVNRLFFGLASGGIPVSAYSTRNYVGVSFFDSPVSALTAGAAVYTSSSVAQNDFLYASTAGYLFRKYDTTYQVGSQMGVSTLYLPLSLNPSASPISPAALARRAMFVLDITRPIGGNGNATVSFYFFAYNAAVNIDMRPDHLFNALYTTGTPTINGIAMAVGLNAVATQLGDEFGPLDTFSIFWNRNTFGLEIFAAGAVVLLDEPYTSPSAAWESFEGYQALDPGGTVVPGVTLPSYGTQFNTYPTTGTMNVPQGFSNFVYAAGTGYSNPSAGTIYFQGRSDPGAVGSGTVGYAGPTLGMPGDTGNNYAVGTVLSGVTGAGTTWAGSILTAGYANPFARTDLWGTTVGWPYDTFESYGTGTIISNVTLNGGTNWVGNGLILGPP